MSSRKQHLYVIPRDTYHPPQQARVVSIRTYARVTIRTFTTSPVRFPPANCLQSHASPTSHQLPTTADNAKTTAQASQQTSARRSPVSVVNVKELPLRRSAILSNGIDIAARALPTNPLRAVLGPRRRRRRRARRPPQSNLPHQKMSPAR